MNFKKINNVTIGSDPEMFLWSEEKQKFVPVCGLIGGTKDQPLPISDTGHFIQEDNVAVEFCIPPCKTEDEFVDNLLFGKEYVQKRIESMGLSLKCVASANFDINDLQSEQAKHFGCDPDFNVYLLDQNVIDKSKIDPTLRSCGMHIHVGYDNHNPETSFELVKAFDLIAVLPSILIDDDTQRRSLYGKAGCFRIKEKYGIELRSLSGYFMNSENSMRWVYQKTMESINFVNSGGIITNESDIEEAINTSNKELAEEILDDYRILNNYEFLKLN